METNKIMDIIANHSGSRAFDCHFLSSHIAYETGTFIELWDLEKDLKIMLHPHDYDVTCIKFFGPKQEYLLSLDGNIRPSLHITEWENLTKIHQIYLPFPQKNLIIQKFLCDYSLKDSILILAEIYNNHTYMISLWEFKINGLNLLVRHEDSTQDKLISIQIFQMQNELFFSMIETKCIKYWKYKENRIMLMNKVHVRVDIIDAKMCISTNLLIFITQNGKAYLINMEGQYVNSINNPDIIFTCLTLHNDYMFLGCLKGNVHMYQVSSAKYIKSITNIHEKVFMSRNMAYNPIIVMNNEKELIKDTNVSSLNMLYYIKKLYISPLENLLFIVFGGNQIYFYDIEKNKIINSLNGHSKKVNQIIWNPRNKTYFISCSNDGSIRKWNYVGDRWRCVQIIYLIEPLEPNLYTLDSNDYPISQITKKNSRKDHKDYYYKITCISIAWEFDEIYAGDNQGNVKIYELNTGKLKNKLPIAGLKIKCINQSRNYIGIATKSGYMVLYDKTSDFQNSIKLEDSLIEVGTFTKYKKGLILIEPEPTIHQKSTKYMNSSALNTNQDEKPNSNPLIKTKVLTTHSSNCMRLTHIVRNMNILTSMSLITYNIDGQIMDYNLHPSLNYILILSSDGYIYIYRIDNAELIGRILVNGNSSSFSIDPSGLYIIVISSSSFLYPIPDNKPGNRLSPLRRSSISDKFSNFNGKDHKKYLKLCNAQCNLSLFELGTAQKVGEMKNNSKITSISFTYDGSQVSIGTSRGLITVMILKDYLKENIYEGLDAMRTNPALWNDFQIQKVDESDQQQDFRDINQQSNSRDDKIQVYPHNENDLPKNSSAFFIKSKSENYETKNNKIEAKIPKVNKVYTKTDQIFNDSIQMKSYKEIQDQLKKVNLNKLDYVPSIAVQAIRNKAITRSEEIRSMNTVKAGMKMRKNHVQKDKSANLEDNSDLREVDKDEQSKFKPSNRIIQPDPTDIDVDESYIETPLANSSKGSVIIKKINPIQSLKNYELNNDSLTSLSNEIKNPQYSTTAYQNKGVYYNNIKTESSRTDIQTNSSVNFGKEESYNPYDDIYEFESKYMR